MRGTPGHSLNEIALRRNRMQQPVHRRDTSQGRVGQRWRRQGSQQPCSSDFPLPIGFTRSYPRRYPSKAAPNILARFMPSCSAAVLITATLLSTTVFELGNTRGCWGIKLANAASCNPSDTSAATKKFNISLSNVADLTSGFDCEGGEFEVTLLESVTVHNTIRLGYGTTVSIIGDYDNGVLYDTHGRMLLVGDDDDGRSQNGESPEIIAGSAYGPIFVVDGAYLYLENVALRSGNTANSSSPEPSSGAGLHALDANIIVVGCEFEDMFADNWGAGIFANRSRVVVRDTLFRRCASGLKPEAGNIDADGAGGAIAVRCLWRLVLELLHRAPLHYSRLTGRFMRESLLP